MPPAQSFTNGARGAGCLRRHPVSRRGHPGGKGPRASRRLPSWTPEGQESRLRLSGSPTNDPVNLTNDSGASSGTDPITGYPSGDILWAIAQANANSNTADRSRKPLVPDWLRLAPSAAAGIGPGFVCWRWHHRSSDRHCTRQERRNAFRNGNLSSHANPEPPVASKTRKKKTNSLSTFGPGAQSSY